VLDCGARGDGVADDTAAQRAALAAVNRGGTVSWPQTGKCYRTTDSLAVLRPMTLSGNGTICWTRTRKPGFTARIGGLVFDGLVLAGPQHAAYHFSENAIDIAGAFRPGAAPGYIENITIRNCTIRNWGDTGILINYVRNITLANNRLDGFVYAGMGLASVSDVRITGNEIRDVNGKGVPDAYGLYISRASNDRGDLVSQPRSTNVIVRDNRSYDIPTSQAYDTHGGQDIVFENNQATRTGSGIAVGGSRNSAGEYVYAPLNVTVRGNVADSGVTDGSRIYGITFTGTPTQAATGLIANNRVTGYGKASVTTGAINIVYTSGLTVSGNVVRDPSPIGIFLGGENRDLTVSDNEVTGPWTDSADVGAAVGLRMVGSNNSVTVSNNRFLASGRKAAFSLATKTGIGMRFSTGSGNRVVIQGNRTDGTLPFYDEAGGVVTSRAP
jgi:predicted outer membrane repeat protein